jgi:hypothetical protein
MAGIMANPFTFQLERLHHTKKYRLLPALQ